jgi:hypothetical protein
LQRNWSAKSDKISDEHELSMSNYYILQPGSSNLLSARNLSYGNREIKKCQLNPDHSDINRRIGPLSIELQHNRRDEIIIWSWLESCVIHTKLLADFEQKGFKGYRILPASVRFKDGSVSNDYHEFIVTGWAGMAKPESGIQLLEECPGCSWKRYSPITNYSEVIDWSQWTGEDFFIVWPMPTYRFVTDKVAKWLQEHKVKTFSLEKLQERHRLIAELDFTVTRLSNHLPADLASRYGDPLGID